MVADVERSIEYWTPKLWGSHERFISRCARVSHRSEDRMEEDETTFVKRIVKVLGHQSVAEHAGVIFPHWPATLECERILRSMMAQNMFIQVEPTRYGLSVLLNGRHLVELAAGLSLASRKDVLTSRDLVALSEPFFPNLLPDVQPDHDWPGRDWPVDAHEYLEDCGLHLATYRVKGLSRIAETQWVRSRTMSYTVRSGRSVDYAEIPTVHPNLKNVEWTEFEVMATRATRDYQALRADGVKKEDARFILPQGLTTEMVVTASFRWWKHWLEMRLHPKAQWEIRSFARAIAGDLAARHPLYFKLPGPRGSDERKVELTTVAAVEGADYEVVL